MQYKKEELKNAILAEAEKEFFEKGYQHASVRQIAKRVGTTIGNIYNYFENKEELFEALVKNEYEGFQYFINNHDAMEKPEQVWENADLAQWKALLLQFINSFAPIFTKRFYILLSCSEGTRYEKAKPFFIQFMKEHFLEHLEQMQSKCSKELGGIVAEQLLGGILAIIRDYEDEKQKTELIVEFILFFFMGYMGILTS